MKKIKFSKSWLIGIVSGLLIVAILGTSVTVFSRTNRDGDKPLSSTNMGAVAGQPGYGKYVGADGVLTYSYEGWTSKEINWSDWSGVDLEDTLGFALASKPVLGGNAGNNAVMLNNGVNDFLKIEKTETGMSRIYFPVIEQGGSTYVFETDFKWGGCVRFEDNGFDWSWAFRIEMRSDINNNGANPAFCSVYGVVDHRFDARRVSLSNEHRNYETDVVMKADNWYSLRIEYTPITSELGECSIYIDNMLMSTFYSDLPGNDSFNYVAVELRSKTPETSSYVDNTYVSTINK